MHAALRVGVDAWNLTGDRRGIGRYARAIVDRWHALGPSRIRMTLIVPERPAWLHAKRYQRALGGLELPVRSRAEAAAAGLDVVWFPWNGMSWSAPLVTVATLHDASLFALAPDDPAVREREQRTFRRAAAEADRIVTDSRFSRDELIRYLALDPERVDVVPLGVDASRWKADPATLPPDLPDRYLLFVGEQEKRKGIDTLLAAAAALPDALRDSTAVVLAGARAGSADVEIPAGVRVCPLGHVDDRALAALYANAAALVYPSRYEGFGLPVLEAMASGTPVVASDAASIPEAGGDAALYFPAGEHESLARAIERVLTEPHLVDDLRAAGRRRAAELSWEKAAEATLEVLERAVRG